MGCSHEATKSTKEIGVPSIHRSVIPSPARDLRTMRVYFPSSRLRSIDPQGQCGLLIPRQDEHEGNRGPGRTSERHSGERRNPFAVDAKKLTRRRGVCIVSGGEGPQMTQMTQSPHEMLRLLPPSLGAWNLPNPFFEQLDPWGSRNHSTIENKSWSAVDADRPP